MSAARSFGFAPDGCQVVQILPESVAETWTVHFAHQLGHRVVFILAKVLHEDERELAGRLRGDLELSYEAPLGPTLAAVDRYLSCQPQVMV